MANKRPTIPQAIKNLLWLRAAGRCEIRGCNRILYEDDITQDPINESNIAHIVSWTHSGPRGDVVLSPKLATDITNLMLVCPRHNHMIDRNVEKYTVARLQEMKKEHEDYVREFTELNKPLPYCVIELKSLIHGSRPSITEKEEADALFPSYPQKERIVIDLCDIDNVSTAKSLIDSKVKKYINIEGNVIYAAFIMALIPYGCYLGYTIGDKIHVKTFQHFRDTEDWIWRQQTKDGLSVKLPSINGTAENVNLFINISGNIDEKLVSNSFPTYSINADNPSVSFLQTWDQVVTFRSQYRNILDTIRKNHGELVVIHLYPATPNPINFEIGKGIMKNLDPTIILYDKSDSTEMYVEIMHLHDRIR